MCIGAREFPLTGLAHGNAGIAYALLTIAERTADVRFQEGARAAIRYEREHFCPERRNWPDLRSSGSFANAWCHGAPGIGLSRLCSLPLLDDQLLIEEINAALTTTLSDGFGGCHILCHGDLGNVDILLHAAAILGEPRWKLHARQHAARVMETAKKSGWNCGLPLGVESPGFMNGLAGVGYALLRLTDPARVPCLLALEPPRLS
jgi:lantibiotic modifying enzyme